MSVDVLSLPLMGKAQSGLVRFPVQLLRLDLAQQTLSLQPDGFAEGLRRAEFHPIGLGLFGLVLALLALAELAEIDGFGGHLRIIQKKPG